MSHNKDEVKEIMQNSANDDYSGAGEAWTTESEQQMTPIQLSQTIQQCVKASMGWCGDGMA
jgi:hypothetical protein